MTNRKVASTISWLKRAHACPCTRSDHCNSKSNVVYGREMKQLCWHMIRHVELWRILKDAQRTYIVTTTSDQSSLNLGMNYMDVIWQRCAKTDEDTADLYGIEKAGEMMHPQSCKYLLYGLWEEFSDTDDQRESTHQSCKSHNISRYPSWARAPATLWRILDLRRRVLDEVQLARIRGENAMPCKRCCKYLLSIRWWKGTDLILETQMSFLWEHDRRGCHFQWMNSAQRPFRWYEMVRVLEGNSLKFGITLPVVTPELGAWIAPSCSNHNLYTSLLTLLQFFLYPFMLSPYVFRGVNTSHLPLRP